MSDKPENANLMPTYRTWQVISKKDGHPIYPPEAKGESKSKIKAWLQHDQRIARVEIKEVKR